MLREYLCRSCVMATIVFSLFLLGCSTVNRVVNMPFRAFENVLGTSERLATDPNSFSRMFDRGVRASSRLAPQKGVFHQSLGTTFAAPISYHPSLGSKDDPLGSSRDWDMAIPLLP